jgi:hypothetical protein
MISNDFNQSIFHIAIIPFISDIYHVLDIITVVSVFWIILWVVKTSGFNCKTSLDGIGYGDSTFNLKSDIIKADP